MKPLVFPAEEDILLYLTASNNVQALVIYAFQKRL